MEEELVIVGNAAAAVWQLHSGKGEGSRSSNRRTASNDGSCDGRSVVERYKRLTRFFEQHFTTFSLLPHDLPRAYAKEENKGSGWIFSFPWNGHPATVIQRKGIIASSIPNACSTFLSSVLRFLLFSFENPPFQTRPKIYRGETWSSQNQGIKDSRKQDFLKWVNNVRL